MASTIYEVAQKSGFSIGTVSRVLNGVPLHTETTREKVLQAIDELNFQPDAMAQGLARRKTNTVGVVVPLWSGHAFTEILAGVQRGLEQHHFDLLLYGIDDPHRQEDFLQKALQKRRVDGLLLVSLKLSGVLAVACKRQRLPLVLVDNFHHQFDAVTIDYHHGALLAIRHLLGLGYRHYAILAGHEENLAAQDRLQASRQALRDMGADLSEPTIITGKPSTDKAGVDPGDFKPQAGYAAMKNFLERRFQNGEALNLPLAVFITSNEQMLGAITAVREAGWRIPDDIALIGFADNELAAHVGLLTMRQPAAEMGYQAVLQMMALLRKPDSAPQHVCLKPELLVRKSWGAERRR